MTSNVKRRPYNSPRHRAQRARTRHDIVAAATALFTERGYAATTVDRIAARAEVAPATVYAVFGTKRDVLLAAMDVAAAGDAEQVTIAERLHALAHDHDDPRELLERIAHFVCEVAVRSADLHRAFAQAAAVDAELTPLFEQAEEARHADARLIADLILGPDHPERARADAADVIFAIVSYPVWDLLRSRGWTPEQIEQWLTATLAAVLPSSAFSTFGGEHGA